MSEDQRRKQLHELVAKATAEAERAPRSAIPYLQLTHAYEQLASLDANFSERAPLTAAAYQGRTYPELPPEGPPLLRRSRHWLRCRVDVWKKLVALEPDSTLYRAKLFETIDLVDDIELPLSLFAHDEVDAVLAALRRTEEVDAEPHEEPLSRLTSDEIDAGIAALHPLMGADVRPSGPPTRHEIWSHFFALRHPAPHLGYGWDAAIVLAGIDHPAVDLRLARWIAAVARLPDVPAPKVAALDAALRRHGGARLHELLRIGVGALSWVTRRAERTSVLWPELMARQAASPTAIDCTLLAELAATQAPRYRAGLLETLSARSWLDRASIAKGLGAPLPPCARTDRAVPSWVPAASAADMRDPLTGAFHPSVLLTDPPRGPIGEFRATLQPDCPLEVVMIDIDCFKNTNNRFGHLVGDDVLRQLVDYLHTEVGDRVVRQPGDDEFWIPWEAQDGLALSTYLVEAIGAKKWIRSRLEVPGTHVSLTVSAGAAAGASLAEAHDRARAALREAKRLGRTSSPAPGTVPTLASRPS